MSPIIYRLKNGSKFISVDKPRYDETEGWIRIEYLKGQFGWISKTYSKIIDLLEPDQILVTEDALKHICEVYSE